MAGTAVQRRPGVWQLRAYVGRDPLTGKKVYDTETHRADWTAAQARAKANEFAVRARKEPAAADMTFGELCDKWFSKVGPRMVPAGQRETEWMISSRLAPLRDKKLSVIAGRTGTAVLDEFYAALRARGGLCRKRLDKCSSYPCEHGGGAPLADSTVIRTHVVVRAALEQALKWGYIDRNPAELADPGEVDEDEIDPPAPSDVMRLFALAEEQNPELVVFLVLAATTGQRRGRVNALQWNDLDLDSGVAKFRYVLSVGAGGVERVKVRRNKRNKKGGRVVVPLDESVVAILLAHREQCRARCELAGVTLADSAFVFTSDEGVTPWHPQSVTRWFRKLRDKAGLDETRLHDLRHFVISYLIGSGVDLAVVKELVGHSATSRTTLERYAHAVSDNKREATGILARLLALPEQTAPRDPNVIPFRRKRKAG